MQEQSLESIARKLDALNLWEPLLSYTWALRPKGALYPYFCAVLTENNKLVKARLLLLEGWQTFHDFVHTRFDASFGYVTSPLELPHYELIVLTSGEFNFVRYDTGYMPRQVDDESRGIVAKMLWQIYGIMLRFETDAELLMRFFSEGAAFSRVEKADGTWVDEPLKIIPAKPFTETVQLPQALVKTCADLPLASGETIRLDFRLMPRIQLSLPPRPRTIYGLVGLDAKGNVIINERVVMAGSAGLKGLWQTMPTHLLKAFVHLGKVPGEIWLSSARVFRLLRPICADLPLRLTLKDSLPELDAAYDKLIELEVPLTKKEPTV